MDRDFCTIRRASLQDLCALADFDRLIFEDFAWDADGLARELASAHTLYFVAEAAHIPAHTLGQLPAQLLAQGSIIGSVGAAVHTGPRASVDIHTLAVHPRCRRMGVARALLASLLAQLIDSNVRELFLEVKMCNVTAIKFYLSIGFEKLSIRKGYYTKRTAQGVQKHDAYVMRVDFDTLYKRLQS